MERIKIVGELIGSLSNRTTPPGSSYREDYSKLYLQSNGLVEVTGFHDYVFVVDGFPWDHDENTRDVPPGEYETMFKKYSISEETIQRIRS